MPKPTPEDYWQARPDLPENPYSNNDLERIVQIIEAGEKDQLSPAERKRLLAHVRGAARAFILATHQDKGPTHGQIKAALEELHIAADKLLRVVKRLDDATVFALWRQHGEFRKAYKEARDQNNSSDKAQVGAIRIVSALSSEAKAAIKEVGKPHPPPDENLLDWIIDWEMDPIYRDETPVTKFIIWLAEIFYEITGSEPRCKHDRARDTYSGDFLLFVKACLTPLESKQRKALGRTVLDALPKWRDARDARA